MQRCVRVCCIQRTFVCVFLLIAHACACMCVVNNCACMPVCVACKHVCASSAHTVFYRGASPTSICCILVSSALDNTACSIIMRHHTPLGMQADKAFFLPSFLSSHSLLTSLLLSVFLLKVSFSSLLLVVLEIASTLNQLHSTSTSTESVSLYQASTDSDTHTHAQVLIIISPKKNL